MTVDFSELDDAICRFLLTSDGQPSNSSELRRIAINFTSCWYLMHLSPLGQAAVLQNLINRRKAAMRRQGRIKFVGRGKNNSSGKSHGWIVCQQPNSTSSDF
jgi:hypothetical protein